MSRTTTIKVGVVVLFVTAALASPPDRPNWMTYGLIAVGLLNVFLEAPGTKSVRYISSATAFGLLLWHDTSVTVWGLIMMWLIWPPAFMVSWALAHRDRSIEAGPSPEQNRDARRARIGLAAIIAAVAVGSVAYRLIVLGGLQQTAALFVGIPALLAIVVVFAVSPRSAVGVACKAVTVGLLVSLVVLDEGILCIAMSAPLFYAIAAITAKLFLRGRPNKQTTVFSSLILLAVLPMTFEGVFPGTTFDRNEIVSRTRVIHASPADVEHSLFETPRFDRPLPLYLKAGFPRPILTEITNTSDGMQWRIRFRGGEMKITGVEPLTGDLILTVEESRPGYIRWHATSDSSHMTHFLRWREIAVQWTPVDGGSSRVTWTVKYERGLDPAWYFGPFQRYAVGLAVDYLLDSVATP